MWPLIQAILYVSGGLALKAVAEEMEREKERLIEERKEKEREKKEK